MDFDSSSSIVRVGVYLHSTREELVEVAVPSKGTLLDLTAAIANHPDLSEGGGCFADDLTMVLCRAPRRLWVRKARPDHHEEDSAPLLIEVDLASLYGRSNQKRSAEEAVAPSPTPSQPPLLLADYGIGEGSRVYIEGLACCEGCRTAGEAEHSEGCAAGGAEQPSALSFPAASVATIVGAVITDMGQVEADLRRQLAEAIRRGEEALSREKAAHKATLDGKNVEIGNLQSRLSTAQSSQYRADAECSQLRLSLETAQRELRQLQPPTPPARYRRPRYEDFCVACGIREEVGASGKCDDCFYR